MIHHLYFVRHGQSTANLSHIYAGQKADVQLTDLGREQAARAVTVIRPWSIDRIFSSDLDRAKETARIIVAGLGLSETLITEEPLLREIDPGELTGQPEDGFVKYLDYVARGNDATAETPEVVAHRLGSFLESLTHMPGENILLVSHAGVGRVLRSVLEDTPISVLAEQSVGNAQPFELPLDRLKDGIS